MASATLNGSVITVTLDSNDRGHVSVEFIDASSSPKGKRVELSDGGSAGIAAWTNAPATHPGDRTLSSTHPEYTVYPPTGSSQTLTFAVRKAATITNNLGQFQPFAGDIQDPAGDHWLDSVHAVAQSTWRFHYRRWTFTDGQDRVIITILMQDDEGGGDGFLEALIGNVVLTKGGAELRINVNDAVRSAIAPGRQ